MKKDSFVRCLNCNESLFLTGTSVSCPHCNGNDFSEPEMYYWDFCAYCLSVKYFDEDIENAKCPDCGWKIDIQNDPLSEVKAAISWFKKIW